MLLQRRHLLHSRPVDQPTRTQIQPVSSRTYLYTFITFDVLSIIIQAIGGGMASSAGGKSPPGNTKPGTHVMMSGIIIQLVSMSIFGILWLVFVWRARAEPYSRTLVLATTFSAFCIIVRNFYRAIELSQGWKGYLITHEVYFAVLDGALMTLAVSVFNIFFPARYLSGEPRPRKSALDRLSSCPRKDWNPRLREFEMTQCWWSLIIRKGCIHIGRRDPVHVLSFMIP